MSTSSATTQQKQAYFIGSVVALLSIVALMIQGPEGWWQPGPDNVGHEEIECQACHQDAGGSLRQQLQANLQYALGRRSEAVAVIHAPAGNAACLDCHENESDLHPMYRFNEPRFAEARQAISPQYCGSCHQQHQGLRASIDFEFCRHCHEDTRLEDEPLDISHEQLTAEARWETCMGCHDFHGNHDGEVPDRMAMALSESQVRDYLEGGRSPYGNRKKTVMQTMKVKQ